MKANLDLAAVRSVPRIDQYFGLWAVDPIYFGTAWDQAKRLDLAAHVQHAHEPKQVVTRRMATASAAGTSRNTIAAIELTGLLMKGESSMYDSTSTIRARKEIRRAAQDPSVGGILLIFDSPGGTAAGTADLAREIAGAAATKPVYAFVEDLAASAAYYAASQASKIFANDRTAWVGSIGTLIGLYDRSKQAEQEGIEAVVIATGPLKGTGFDGASITTEQRAALQDLVNSTQQSFDAAVQAGRGLSDTELQAVKTGGVWLADEAQRLKLIDGIQTLEETLAQLADAIAGQTAPGERSVSQQQEPQTGLAALDTNVARQADDQAADELKDKADELKDEADELKDEADELKDKADELKDEADTLKDEADALKDETDSETEAETETEEPDAGQSAADPRRQCARYMEAFGPQGAQWFVEGKTFEQAQTLHCQALTRENAELQARLASIAGAGEPAPVSFQADATEPGPDGASGQRAARLAQNIGPNLARYAAGLTLAKRSR